MTTQNTDKILDTISKLLAVSEGRGATEAEAHAANAHVQRLLQEHNLTLSQVESRSGASDDGKRRQDEITVLKSTRMAWQQDLLAGIASSNFCLTQTQYYWVNNQKRRRVVLVGREVNVAATRMMYSYLLEACLREMMNHGYSKMEKGRLDHDSSYFCTGMTVQVVDRLRERRAEREAGSQLKSQPISGNGTHRELVLSDVYGSETDLNNDFLNKYPPGTTAARRREAAELEARISAEEERLKAENVEWVEAWYRARGYSQDQAVQHAASYHKSGRRSSRRGGRGGSAHNWSRRDQSEHRKVNSAAYRSGLEAGSSVGLDDQVGASSRKRIPGKETSQ